MDQEKLAKLIAQEKAFKEKFGDPSSDDVKSTKSLMMTSILLRV